MAGYETTLISAALQTGLKTVQSNAAAKQAYALQNRDRQAQIQRIERTRQIEDQRRKAQLKRALATQRARFGASGVSSSGGSAASLLTGLQRAAEGETARAWELAGMDIDTINRRSRRDLLDASSQRNQFLFGQLQRSIPIAVSLLE